MSHLVDSDWLIDAIAGIPSAVEPLDRLGEAALAISIVTIGEVYEGTFGSSDADARLTPLRRFLSAFRILPLTEPIMEIFARHRADLRRRGMLIPDLDLIIAATALHHDLILMTRNVRHFSRIADLQLYQPH